MRVSLIALIAAANLGGIANLGPAPTGTAVPKLSPDPSWDGIRTTMINATPSLDTTYQGLLGFYEEPIVSFDERPGIWIEKSNYRIVVGAVNGDQKRLGIKKVIFRLGNSSIESSQQVFTSRKTCGFPVDLSSSAKDGDAILFADIIPNRGIPTRISLPLFFATRGDIKRPRVFVNPDTVSHNVVDADTGQTIVVAAGYDGVTRQQATGSDNLSGDPAYAFKSIQAAQNAFANYNLTLGSCDVLCVPDTNLMCDNAWAPLAFTKLAPNKTKDLAELEKPE